MLQIALQLVPVLILSYASQVLMKHGVNSIGAISWPLLVADPIRILARLLLNWHVILGFILAGIGAVLYLFALSRTDLTVALPILGALGFLVLPVIGTVFLQETISPQRLMGTLVIAIGMVIVAQS
jgi:drug/metabolite transporter (DMT)-like permease